MVYRIKLLGEGAYNKAYKVFDDEQVYGVFKFSTYTNKQPEPLSEQKKEYYEVQRSLDDPSRAVRIWNEINPDLRPKAKEFELIINRVRRKGWLAPYIEGREATDTEKAKLLTKVYNETGRIIIDGVGEKNIITDKKGRTICVDIGLALKLDNEYGPLQKINDIKNKKELPERKGSITGIAAFREESVQTHYQNNFYPTHTSKEAERKHYYSPHSVNVTKSLIFINKHLEHERDLSFLNKDHETAKAIAAAYDKELSHPENSSASVEGAINLIKSLIFINRHQLDFKNVSFFKLPKTNRIIADAYDRELSNPEQTPNNRTAKDHDTEYMRYLIESELYLAYLKNKDPKALVIKKMKVIEEALNILKSDLPLRDIKENFINHIKDQMPILTKRTNPRLKKFLKGLGVAAASIFGLGLGGFLAYKHLYKTDKAAAFLAKINVEESSRPREQNKEVDQPHSDESVGLDQIKLDG